jgi:hypothetical protein
VGINDGELEFSGTSTKTMRKILLSVCGGNFTEAYYKLMSLDLLYLAEELDIYKSYQEEVREEQERQQNKSKTTIPI